ncbi:hypothetical protein Hanom_Chr14g01286821 [Helianthus anomalus]
MLVLVRSNDENNTAVKCQNERASPTPIWAVVDAMCNFSFCLTPYLLVYGVLSTRKTKRHRRRPPHVSKAENC